MADQTQSQRIQDEFNSLQAIMEDFSNQLVAQEMQIQEQNENGKLPKDKKSGFFEPWATKLITQLGATALAQTRVSFSDADLEDEPQESSGFGKGMQNSSLKAQMNCMVAEFVDAVCEIESQNKSSIAILKEEWDQLENNLEQIKSDSQQEEAQANRRYLNVPKIDNNALLKVQSSSQAELDMLIQGLTKKNEAIQQSQKILISATNQSMQSLLTNLMKSTMNQKININDLRKAGNVYYQESRVTTFPTQVTFDRLHSEGAAVDFRLIGISRPNDSSKNRWNFIFSNGQSTTTDLEVACSTHNLNNEGRGLIKVEIYQSNENPLYGLKFHFENGQSQMIGLTGSKTPDEVKLSPGERIVAIQHRSDKHMYRYGLCFLIAKAGSSDSMAMPQMDLALNVGAMMSGAAVMSKISYNMCRKEGKEVNQSRWQWENYPSQSQLDQFYEKGYDMSKFRCIGMRRPTDAAKNRWNFIFTNDIISETDLAENCESIYFPQMGENLRSLTIYQNGEDPLWGVKAVSQNGDEKIIGKTNNQSGTTIYLERSDRIVGWRFKADKQMYRYGLNAYILNGDNNANNIGNSVVQPVGSGPINFNQLQEQGNIMYTADRLMYYPDSNQFDQFNQWFNMSTFCLTAINRPTDSSKNRWNFVFSNNCRTSDNLEVACQDHFLVSGGTTVSEVIIYQQENDPLYGMKFIYRNGQSSMYGHSNGLSGKRIVLQQGQRIVGIRYRKDKPMYRYGLRFLIAN